MEVGDRLGDRVRVRDRVPLGVPSGPVTVALEEVEGVSVEVMDRVPVEEREGEGEGVGEDVPAPPPICPGVLLTVTVPLEVMLPELDREWVGEVVVVGEAVVQ